jgi:hypothetical protein
MLRQIWHYFGGIKVQEIDNGGNVFTVSRDGTESATHGGVWNWANPFGAPVGEASHDPDAGTDPGDEGAQGAILFNAATGTRNLTLACDGTPGRLIFLNLGTRTGNTMVPAGDGWSLLATSSTTSGTGHPYQQFVYWKIVGPYESFTSVDVVCTHLSGSGTNDRFIGRALNVAGEYPANPIIQVATSSGSTTLVGAAHEIATPALTGQAFEVRGIAFIQGRLTTYSTISVAGAGVGAWEEIDAERTAGATGIGIDEQQVIVPTTGQPSGTLTLGATSAVNMIFVTIQQKLDVDWWHFWLKLVPAADQGIESWGEIRPVIAGSPVPVWGGNLQPGRGYTIGQKGVTPGDAAVVKNLFRGARPWKMAGTKAEWLILVLGQDEDHAPNGKWQFWTYGGVPQRQPTWRFWKL